MSESIKYTLKTEPNVELELVENLTQGHYEIFVRAGNGVDYKEIQVAANKLMSDLRKGQVLGFKVGEDDTFVWNELPDGLFDDSMVAVIAIEDAHLEQRRAQGREEEAILEDIKNSETKSQDDGSGLMIGLTLGVGILIGAAIGAGAAFWYNKNHR